MNILFVHDKPSGGAGESLLQIIQSIRGEHQPHVIFAQEGFLKDKYKAIQDEVPVYYHPMAAGSWLLNRDFNNRILNYARLGASLPFKSKFVRFIVKKAKEHKIDVIYSNTIYLIEGAIAAKILGIPHIWQIRELYDLDYYKYCLPKQDVTKILGWFSKKIVCNSYRTREVVKKFGGNLDKVEVIHNLVNPPKENLDIKAHLNLPSHVKTACILGWITPNKMIEDFLAVADQFSDNDIKFLIIGGFGGRENYNNKIKELLASNNNKANIIHTGIIPTAVNYLNSVDVLLCPCYTESFGRTVAEAQVVGTPAIGIKGSATQELIQDKISGYIVEKSDIEAMTKHTKTLLENDQLRAEMGEAGQQYILANFSKQALLSKYLKLFNDAFK